MYCFPKLHKTPIGDRFIIASKNFGTKPLSCVISKVFKMLSKRVENFHNKSTFYSSYKKFCVVGNSILIIEKLDIINTRKRAKKLPIMILAHCIRQYSR